MAVSLFQFISLILVVVVLVVFLVVLGNNGRSLFLFLIYCCTAPQTPVAPSQNPEQVRRTPIYTDPASSQCSINTEDETVCGLDFRPHFAALDELASVVPVPVPAGLAVWNTNVTNCFNSTAQRTLISL